MAGDMQDKPIISHEDHSHERTGDPDRTMPGNPGPIEEVVDDVDYGNRTAPYCVDNR